MNLELIKQIILVAIGASVLSTATIQKIKEVLKSKKWLFLAAFGASNIIGILFALSFTELTLISSIWVGLVTWLGADTIYKAFEDKIFTSFGNLEKIVELKRDDE